MKKWLEENFQVFSKMNLVSKMLAIICNIGKWNKMLITFKSIYWLRAILSDHISKDKWTSDAAVYMKVQLWEACTANEKIT